jgi:sortase system peptidoglycan-associated protein
MKKQLVSIAIVSSLLAGTHTAYANEQDATDTSNKQYIGAGIGAVAGALVAGPVGFVAGGLLGNLAGKHDAMSSIEKEVVSASEHVIPGSTNSTTSQSSNDTAMSTIIVAQAGETEPVIDNDLEHTSNLKDILVSELNMDIFFLSGSTAVEGFYQPRLASVAMLMHEMPGIDVYLDGFSDRRGDRDANLALSVQRLESVRKQLVQAGIDESRIHINALGEQQFVSRPGDLEAYTFDRRVVIRFGRPVPAIKKPVAQIEQIPAI